MMDYVTLALQHAARGWFVFPVSATKHPLIKGWPERATTDAETIATWFMYDYPGALPAIVPGRSGKTVIDFDAHDGKPNGFHTAEARGYWVTTPHTFTSRSGKGGHAYYDGTATSVNGTPTSGIGPGIDRKSIGGLVVAAYELPHVGEVTTPLPEYFAKQRPSGPVRPVDDVDSWLASHSGKPVSPVVQRYFDSLPTPFRGHDALLQFHSAMVRFAGEGHGGVPELLAAGRDLWEASPHNA